MVGLPLYLFNSTKKLNSIDNTNKDGTGNDKSTDDRKMPKLSYLKIQRKGLLKRVLISTSCYAVITVYILINIPIQNTLDLWD